MHSLRKAWLVLLVFTLLISAIRAYGVTNLFLAINKQMVDTFNQQFFFIWAANRWLCLRTDVLSSVVVFSAGVAVVVSGIDSGWAALTITYAMDFTNVLLWTVRMVIVINTACCHGNEHEFS
jgi:hypothetical protein